MKHGKTKKLLALLLSSLMLIGSAVPVFAADVGSAGNSATTGVTLQQISDMYASINYEEYKSKYEYSEDLRTGQSVTIDARDYYEKSDNAQVEETTWEGRDCLIIGETGTVSWKIDVPETGYYAIKFSYNSASENTNDIERLFALNGKTPFEEAQYLSLSKTWVMQYLSDSREDAFEVDSTGNELRPKASVEYVWDEYIIKDSNGYYINPFEFYLEEGENILSLEGVRESLALESITVYTYEPCKTYDEVLQEYKDNGYKAADAEPILLEAEMPDYVSNYTLYPVYDRSSAITSPQHSSLIYRNTIGANKWITPGQWIQYSFECQASGLYEIVVRYEQSELKGMYTSRSLKINGEYPFEEVKNCQFAYSSNWETTSLNDGLTTFQFYFEEGQTYTLEFEVTLGAFSEPLRMVSEVVENLNNDYMELIKLTGTDPDVNRDYGFSRIMPDVIRNLGTQANILYQLIDYIVEVNGLKSDNTATLEQAALLIEKMVTDEKEIAANLDGLKNWVSSLGTWLSEAATQYLQMDYIQIQPADSELPQGEASGWASVVFELKKFIASFYADYNSIGSNSDGEESVVLELWTSLGRDQAQIIKNLIQDGFTRETKIGASIKLTAAGTLLPSILAGVGPDISIDATDPIDMAIRGAIIPLNDFDTFDEVMGRFADCALTQLSLYGKTYGVPYGQSTSMMFTRDDVLAQLGIEAPETWDDLLSMIPVLQFNNMDVGIAMDYRTMLFQHGGNVYADEGMRSGFDAENSLNAFEFLVNMYTQYSLSMAYDGPTRFKTGEMPVLMGDLNLYNTLVVFAPEISNLWSIHEVPGIRDEETGEVSHLNFSMVSGVFMTRDCIDVDAGWQFLDWFSDKDYQIDYSNEMIALLGPSAKQSLANLEALAEQSWTEYEYKTLQNIFTAATAVPSYPGSYFTDRYATFTIQNAYNQGADPSDTILGYVPVINKEIDRKRKEFRLMISSEWDAIKEYTGFEEFSEWRAYWNEENGITETDDNSCMQYSEEYEYSYRDWMSEKGITTSNFDRWEKEVKNGTTDLPYKDWLDEQ